MTLYEYLNNYPQEKKAFAEKLRIAESTLFKYINGEREPKLCIAIRIHTLTDGKVGFIDMINDTQDAEILGDPVEYYEDLL